MKDKFYRIGDMCIADAVDRCILTYGIEGTEDTINRVYSHTDLQELKKQFLAELYKRYK